MKFLLNININKFNINIKFIYINIEFKLNAIDIININIIFSNIFHIKNNIIFYEIFNIFNLNFERPSLPSFAFLHYDQEQNHLLRQDSANP